MTQTKKPKVLIADDENHLRVMIRTLVTSMNAQIVGEAKNGQEAIDIFKQHQPDIVLLDINMPFKTGDEALKEIIEEYPQAFIIMLTSVADMETVQKCIESGASGYILKDTPIMEMKKMIKDAWIQFMENKGKNDA